LPAACRLHYVGVGSSVNRSLGSALARAGRGAEVICDLDDDAERAARRLLDRTCQPILTDVRLAGSALVACAPAQLPDIFAGAPLVAAVELRGGELVVRGERADGPWEQRITVGAPRPGDGDPAIPALYGREQVADLEARAHGGEATDAAIERAGLAFQIATRFTSWVAIDERRLATGPSRAEHMPQALPYGTRAAAFGLRAPGEAMAAGLPAARTREAMAPFERSASASRVSLRVRAEAARQPSPAKHPRRTVTGPDAPRDLRAPLGSPRRLRWLAWMIALAALVAALWWIWR
jgi:Ca-activated chloride channel homolog